jgi:glyoxylase-like metal-dependent hydrolase (beta-lactamase superfamily II)
MEVAPNIHRIVAPLGNRFVAVFALVGSEATLIVDTGIKDTPTTYIEPYFRENGLDLNKVRYVVISHADIDHSGGNGTLKALTPNAIFMCHELDRAWIENIELMISERYNEWEREGGIPSSAAGDQWNRDNASDIPMDMTLRGGEHIHLGGGWIVDVLHTAGHTWGHLTIYDPTSKTAVIADSALYNNVLTSDGQPAFPPTYRYLDTYTSTIHRLLSMDIDTLLTSHYPVYRGTDVREFLNESLAYTNRVDTALADVLRASGQPMTISEIIATIHKKVGNWPEGAEAPLTFPLTGHLEQMAQYRKIVLGRRDGVITYQWRA